MEFSSIRNCLNFPFHSKLNYKSYGLGCIIKHAMREIDYVEAPHAQQT